VIRKLENQKMKTIKNIIIAFLVGAICSYNINAQDSHTEIGLRLGESTGLTFKYISPTDKAIEAIIGMWNNALNVTVLSEKYVPTGFTGINWYYGVGAQAGFLTNHYFYVVNEYGKYYDIHYGGYLGFGIDGMLGLELKIPAVPFAVSVELKPFAEINTRGTSYFDPDPGLGLKLAF